MPKPERGGSGMLDRLGKVKKELGALTIAAGLAVGALKGESGSSVSQKPDAGVAQPQRAADKKSRKDTQEAARAINQLAALSGLDQAPSAAPEKNGGAVSAEAQHDDALEEAKHEVMNIDAALYDKFVHSKDFTIASAGGNTFKVYTKGPDGKPQVFGELTKEEGGAYSFKVENSVATGAANERKDVSEYSYVTEGGVDKLDELDAQLGKHLQVTGELAKLSKGEITVAEFQKFLEGQGIPESAFQENVRAPDRTFTTADGRVMTMKSGGKRPMEFPETESDDNEDDEEGS